MKKLLAIIMTLMIVLTMSASFVAAEPVETSEGAEQQVETAEPTVPEKPEGYDEESIVQYLVLNFENLEKITLNSYITGNDATLDYYMNMYTTYGQNVEDTEYDGQRALSVGSAEMTLDNLLESAGVIYIGKEGFFADKYTFVYGCGTMMNGGFEEGDHIATVVFDLGKTSKTHDIIAGEQNSFIATKYVYNWTNILIGLMCFVVLLLLIAIAVLKLRKKNIMDDVEEMSKIATEEEVLDILGSEVVEEETEIDATEAMEEIAEEVSEDIEEK